MYINDEPSRYILPNDVKTYVSREVCMWDKAAAASFLRRLLSVGLIFV